MKFIKNTDKEPVSEAEINEKMNFDKFISSYKPPVKGVFSAGAKTYLLIAGLVAGIAVLISMLSKPSATNVSYAPFVVSPLAKMDTPVSDLLIDNSKDSTIIHTTGSLVSIPENAFEDESGNAINGKVEIHYREFHDPIDILFSGIPMNYDSAGVQYQFESGGMFEITATKDGKPLRLRPGKQITVNMISSDPDPDKFNLYALDTVGRKWDYVSENTAANGTCIKAFDERETAFAKEVDRTEPAEEALLEMKPVMPAKSDPARANFSIDFNADEFPELSVFEGIKFEPVKEEKNYNPAMAKRTWEEVSVKRGKDPHKYLVTFSSAKESHSYTVVPVVDEKDYATAMADFLSRQKKYEMALAERLRNSSCKSDSLFQVDARFKALATRGDMEARFNSFISDSFTEATRDLLVYRTFSVGRLGVHNCDVPIPFFATNIKSMTGNYVADFSQGKNKIADMENVFLIQKNVNSLFRVSQEDFDRFPFSHVSVDLIIGITSENELFYMKRDDLNATHIDGLKIHFNMKRVPDEIVKADDLKEFLKI